MGEYTFLFSIDGYRSLLRNMTHFLESTNSALRVVLFHYTIPVESGGGGGGGEGGEKN